MSDLMPGNVLIGVDVERSIAALDPDELPENAGLVALARLYALAIAESGGSQNCLKEIGPKLTATLVALGAGKRAGRGAAQPVVTPAPAEPEPSELESARTDPAGAGSILSMERARAERIKRAGRPA